MVVVNTITTVAFYTQIYVNCYSLSQSGEGKGHIAYKLQFTSQKL